jgi:hypothetical protein
MFCSVAARLWLRAVSAADWFGNITAVVSANGHNAGSDLSEQMCESVAPTVRQ